jgi:hypothetical protein
VTHPTNLKVPVADTLTRELAESVSSVLDCCCGPSVLAEIKSTGLAHWRLVGSSFLVICG